MKDEELDRILSKEADIAPSSGFVHSVMDAVRTEVAAPPPIPFPWRWALPGIAALGAAVVWLIILAFRLPAGGTLTTLNSSFWSDATAYVAPWWYALEMAGAGWILLAVLLTLLSVRLSMRLAGR
jgi:hypothetical protein